MSSGRYKQARNLCQVTKWIVGFPGLVVRNTPPGGHGPCVRLACDLGDFTTEQGQEDGER